MIDDKPLNSESGFLRSWDETEQIKKQNFLEYIEREKRILDNTVFLKLDIDEDDLDYPNIVINKQNLKDNINDKTESKESDKDSGIK